MQRTRIQQPLARVRFRPGRGMRLGAFTVIELLVAIVVIAVLLSILAVGLRLGFRSARSQADATAIASLKTSVTQFKQTLGFFPPLVRDNRYPSGATNLPPLTGGPVAPVPIAAGSRPVVVSLSSDLSPAQSLSMQRFLSHRDSAGQPLTGADWRFSTDSLAYYVVGALPALVDGVDGPGARAARRDGGFESAGRTLDAFFDLSKNSRALYTEDLAAGRVELRDSGGTPIRYYRWLRGRFDPSTQQFDGRVLESADEGRGLRPFPPSRCRW
ncbi:hypothetical protein J4558_14020 [Leptolyngbya sp. 15MV]|nr:hypothetical protein J4558_14020 [Leptolyngbya sp. 15MV]